jgi:hypothetical protein
MKRRKNTLLLAAALLLVVSLALFLRKPAPLDLSKDEEPFKSMVMPPKSAIGLCCMDGGSVAMRVIDKVGGEYYITFPFDYEGVLNAHPNAYHGDYKGTTRVPLKDSSRAKSITIRLLRDYGTDDSEGSTKMALLALSQPVRSAPFRLQKRVKRWFIEWATDF